MIKLKVQIRGSSFMQQWMDIRQTFPCCTALILSADGGRTLWCNDMGVIAPDHLSCPPALFFSSIVTNGAFSDSNAERKKKRLKTFPVVFGEIEAHCPEAMTQEPRSHREKEIVCSFLHLECISL